MNRVFGPLFLLGVGPGRRVINCRLQHIKCVPKRSGPYSATPSLIPVTQLARPTFRSSRGRPVARPLQHTTTAATTLPSMKEPLLSPVAESAPARVRARVCMPDRLKSVYFRTTALLSSLHVWLASPMAALVHRDSHLLGNLTTSPPPPKAKSQEPRAAQPRVFRQAESLMPQERERKRTRTNSPRIPLSPSWLATFT